MVLYPNKLPESERVCSGICILEYELFQQVCRNITEAHIEKQRKKKLFKK